jgi:predicted O-methyltransferase YrrM
VCLNSRVRRSRSPGRVHVHDHPRSRLEPKVVPLTRGLRVVTDEEGAIASLVVPMSDRHFLLHDVERITADVEGWLGPREGALLYRLASEADPSGCIVEIGSWQGKSTIWLAAGSRAGRGARVVAIDPHTGTYLRADGETTEPALRHNLDRAGVSDQVDVVVATSEAAAAGWTRPVSLLWIDGDHEYESVRRDLELWEPHLLPSATVALHDTFVWRGPERVVRERLIRSRRYTSFVHAETTTAARRSEERLPRRDLARRLELARRSLYGVRLRAYDSNTLGYARLRDAFGRPGPSA